MASEEYNNFPFEVRDADPETNAAMRDHFADVQEGDGFVRVGPKGYFLPKLYLNQALNLYNMQTRADQVFVGGYPRSGTTWMQQVVWLIKHDLDYIECDRTSMAEKFLYFEGDAVFHRDIIRNMKNIIIQKIVDTKTRQDKTKIRNIEEVQSNNFLKTHLPLSLLPPKILETSKVVYVARDPRDTIVSFYHLCKGGIWSFKKDFKAMWNCFYKNTLIFCPYFEHVKEFWKERHHPNLLFLFYEDVKNDRMNTLRRVADFFNKSYSEEQLEAACNYLEFNNLKDNKSFNFSFFKEHGIVDANAENFVRKGKVGGWREYFDEGMSREAEQWIADNLRDTDLRFPSIPME